MMEAAPFGTVTDDGASVPAFTGWRFRAVLPQWADVLSPLHVWGPWMLRSASTLDHSMLTTHLTLCS